MTAFAVTQADLQFILDQIKIAEQHAAGVPLSSLIPDPHVPWGLRTVDGTYNNLVAGRETWGSADQPMPRLLDPSFRDDADGDSFAFGPPSPFTPPPVTNTNYNSPGDVADADPRIISNLIVDMSINNPAAIAAFKNNPLAMARWEADHPGSVPLGPNDPAAPNGVLLTNVDLASIPNISPDDGISKPFNGWMTFFGQFFDHGLDLITKGGAGTVYVPLQPDDPLITHGPDGIAGTGDEVGPNTRFMVLTRATPVDGPGADGVLGTADDTHHEQRNTTTPFVDQNQTYTSHASHQLFLREYKNGPDGKPVATGHLLDGGPNQLPTWADIKAQAAQFLGIQLTDADVVNIPLLRTDPYGEFIRGPNGYPQLILGLGPDGIPNTADDIVIEGNPAATVNTFTASVTVVTPDPLIPDIVYTGAVRIGHAFLDDIANAANPINSQTGAFKAADADASINATIVITNDSFEADSTTAGAPGVIADPLGNYTTSAPQGWQISGGAGIYSPTTAVISATGHAGGTVAYLQGGGSLSKDTGVEIETGKVYQLTFNLGDRLDQAFTGGTASLVSTDGTVLATLNLVAPTTDGTWAARTITSGPAVAGVDGQELRIVFTNTGGQQFLIDNVKVAHPTTAYDNELLDAHYITGDGRGNENIGLTAVHHIFHSEHNRQVEAQKLTVLQSGDRAFINDWLSTDLAPGQPLPTDLASAQALSAQLTTANAWDGERLFQAARFATEMQYQHLVFEEFARKIQPEIDVFVFNNITDVNPAIFAEFANTIYRFGHSMLTDGMPRLGPDGEPLANELNLVEAFLNPLAFDDNGAMSHDEAAAAIVRGMVVEHGNAIDEFIVSSLRNNLLGLPLDLAAINIARGRDTGMPTLNEARQQLYAASGSTFLQPYDNWVDFAQNIKNPASVINFIAAYGTHSSIPEDGTLQQKRDAATALVMGVPSGSATVPADRTAFLTGTGAWAGVETGLNTIDLWIGGLAEKILPFGGMLGSTFNAVFELQMENLQDGDRLYYLTRTQGQNLLTSLEQNSFAKLIMANTDLSLPGADGIRGTADDEVPRHIGVDAFALYDFTLEVNVANQADYNGAAAGKDPSGIDPVLEGLGLGKVQRDNPNTVLDESPPDTSLNQNGTTGHYLRFTGGEHIVVGGTKGNDTIITDFGDDGIWGDAGDDRIESGAGVDLVNGGAGDDIITDTGDVTDFLKGDEGNDVIAASGGIGDILMGGSGQDVIYAGVDSTEVFAGAGNDFVIGGDGADNLIGNEGDDWIEGGGGFDTISGDNSELFFDSTIIGHDVMFSGNEEQDFDAESGDDIMVQGESVIRNEGMFGFDWAIYKDNPIAANADLRTPIFTTEQADILRNRFDKVEALSGWDKNDILRGDDRIFDVIPPGATVGDTENVFFNDGLDQAGIARIAGLSQIVSVGPTGFFESGNILLGGKGSDLLQGNGGDDILDGDRWLNVRISVLSQTTGLQIATVDSLKHTFTTAEVAGNPATASWAGKSLFELLISRTVVPTQLSITREILIGNAVGDVDTAQFNDVFANYTVTRNTNGSVTVVHNTLSNVVDPLTGNALVSDGTDTLYNIERLRFSDREINLSNRLATGVPTITGDGAQLTASIAGIADADGLPPIGAFTFTWQSSVDGLAPWTNVGTGLTFSPATNAFIRLIATFTDGAGNIETLTSEMTARVGTGNADNLTGDGGINLINGLGGADVLAGAGGADIINGGGGGDTITGDGGNDILNGGGGNDTVSGNGGDDTIIYDINGGGNDTISGNAGTDTLAIIDTGGGDTLSVAFNGTVITQIENGGSIATIEAVTANLGAGTDTLQYTQNNAVTVNLLTGAASGFTAISNIENVTGAGGNDTFTGNAANNALTGNGGTDRAVFAGAVTAASFALTGGNVAVTTATGGTDTLNTIEELQFGANVYGLIQGNANPTTLDGGAAAELLLGFAGNDTINGGGGNDVIVWGVGDGRDLINGGGGTADTFVINGDGTNEVYRVYARANWLAINPGTLNNANTEIVITRNGTNNASVIAELRNVEEILINTGAGTDTVTPIGNFLPTSLAFNTITINGTSGNNTVDISSLQSAHRILFRSNGGNDTVIGTLRPQDVVELVNGADLSTYTLRDNGNGTKTFSNGSHSITFTGAMPPQFISGGTALPDDDDEPDNEHNHSGSDDDHDDDDTHNAGNGNGSGSGSGQGSGTGSGTGTGTGSGTGLGSGSGSGSGAGTGTGNSTLPFVVYLGTSGNDVGVGGLTNDVLSGGAGDDTLLGLDGNDSLAGGDGDDQIFGGAGDDVALGNDGNDTIFADAGDDTVMGGKGADSIFGGDGNDRIFGEQGRDVIDAGHGNDTIHASLNDGDDVINGGGGSDTLDFQAITAALTVTLDANGSGTATSAQTGLDVLSSIENIKGGAGADVFKIFSVTANVLDGGAGNDTFIFTSAAAADGDTIEGFSPGDTIDLRPFMLPLADDDFLGSGATFSASGQVRLTIDGNDTLVEGNSDDDAAADFAIRIVGRIGLTGNDFA